jgi:hypothetical protein
MSSWENYPDHYRQAEVENITRAASAGECCSLIGLSGAGKSNLTGYLCHRAATPKFILVDCNRVTSSSGGQLASLFQNIQRSLPGQIALPPAVSDPAAALEKLETALDQVLDGSTGNLALVFDRFDALLRQPDPGLYNCLRVLRDRWKYRFAFVTATRHPLPQDNEFAELFFANTFWLGPLSPADADWSIQSFAQRHTLVWDAALRLQIGAVSGAYPAFLRACCEACAQGVAVTVEDMIASQPVQLRLKEFTADQPSADDLRKSHLDQNPLLKAGLDRKLFSLPAEPAPAGCGSDAQLTGGEKRLWDILRAHAEQVISKDELARAVWPDDRYYKDGMRDDALAQMVRRLREKIETNPSQPVHIRTVPGRGYVYYE